MSPRPDWREPLPSGWLAQEASGSTEAMIDHAAAGATEPSPHTPAPIGNAAVRALRRRRVLVGCALIGLLVLFALVAAAIGAVPVPLSEVLAAALGLAPPEPGSLAAQHRLVLESIRFPRVALAAVIGAALGMAGAAMQGMFRNPLADPALIGASSGAALAVAITIVLGNQWLPGFTRAFGIYALPVAAFIGCLVAVLVVKRLATGEQGVSIAAMLLGGVAINVLCEAGINALTFAANDEQLRNFTFWRMGSLAGGSWMMLAVATGCAGIGAWLVWRNAAGLNALAMGEEAARYAGYDVSGLSRRVTFGVALLVAAAVASAGMVWFIGLIGPHGVRMLAGPDQRFLMPASALLGAVLTLAADVISRTIVTPAEWPVGVPIAFFGVPLFVLLLVRAREAGRL